MGDGRERAISDFDMVEAGGVVHEHAPGATSAFALACGGHFGYTQVRAVYPPNIVTCLWCITGMSNNLRWFKWGDES